MAAALGLLAVIVGALTPVGRVVLAVGAVLLILVAGVGFAVRRRIERKYPPVPFERGDVSQVTKLISAAGSRLAAGDSAAFVIYSGDAEGQIWLFAAEDGVVGRVAIELTLPDSQGSSSLPADLETLLHQGWELDSVQPSEWVLLTRTLGIDESDLVAVVVERLTTLFDLSPTTKWAFRALA